MKTVNSNLEIMNVFCNKCEKTCAIPDEYDIVDYYGLIEAPVDGKENSSFLDSEMRYTFSLCEECLVILFNSFKRPPKKQYICKPIDGQLASEKEIDRIYLILEDMEKNHNVPESHTKIYGSLAVSNVSNSLTLLLTWPHCKNKLELINIMEKFRVKYEIDQVKNNYATS